MESGLVHTRKDIEIEPRHIKKIQKTVNDHVYWLSNILQCGKNWQHSDRMAKNLKDEGEQVCQMSLLLKDHKLWSPGDPGPVPSRPVVAGNSSLNCHLSELISSIIEPVAFEESGRKIDSTDDMLVRITEINKLVEEERNSSQLVENPIVEENTETNIDPSQACSLDSNLSIENVVFK